MGEPRWLDEREARAWRGYRQMRDLLDQQINRDLAADSGLSEADYTVLVVLSEEPDQRMRQVELAHRVLWSKSRLSHQLTRMERRGLVRREGTGSASARGVRVVLTAEGLNTIRDAAPPHLESVRRHFIDPLTDEQLDALADCTAAVLAHLRGRRDDGTETPPGKDDATGDD